MTDGKHTRYKIIRSKDIVLHSNPDRPQTKLLIARLDAELERRQAAKPFWKKLITRRLV